MHSHLTGDLDFDSPQKIHTHVVSRIGGVGIFCGMLVGAYNLPSNTFVHLLMCALPVFLCGLAEDMTKKIGVNARLVGAAISAILAIFFLDTTILQTHIPGFDFILKNYSFMIIFSIFAISGVTNAYNIIDGLNGLASGFCVISLTGILIISEKLGDPLLIEITLVAIFSILGFLFLNFPNGHIFLGDGGAYFTGFLIAAISILLVSRHPGEISPWIAIAINSYPIVETIFSIYRRKILHGQSPGEPDLLHLHSLIYTKICRPGACDIPRFNLNAQAAAYIWISQIIILIPSIIWKNSTLIIFIIMTLYVLLYIFLYKKLITPTTPSIKKSQ